MQATIRIRSGFSAIVYGLNLTDEVFGYYTGSPIFVNQREWYKPMYAAVVRYTLNRENNTGAYDRVLSSASRAPWRTTQTDGLPRQAFPANPVRWSQCGGFGPLDQTELPF